MTGNPCRCRLAATRSATPPRQAPLQVCKPPARRGVSWQGELSGASPAVRLRVYTHPPAVLGGPAALRHGGQVDAVEAQRICTVPLTVTLSVPLPASTGSGASSVFISMAARIAYTGCGPLPSLATFTSRTL